MEEKQKNNRNYNVFFNTHTVSGIVISVGLFVCFFAGSFALFLDNINRWENNTIKGEYREDIDFERALALVKADGYNLNDRTINMGYREGANPFIYVSSGALKVEADSITGKKYSSERDSISKSGFYFMIGPDTYEVRSKEFIRDREHLGSYLYALHYFEPIPVVGIYIAGFVALFFLFAIITGIIVHWQKIISNFFTFRLKATIKNLWTDAHTALGVIGIPFQFMYAVTGAFYGLSLLVYLPTLLFVFDGDTDKMISSVFPNIINLEKSGEQLVERADINKLTESYLKELDDLEVENVFLNVINYNNSNAHITFTANIDTESHFFNSTFSIYRLSDGTLVKQKPLSENAYEGSVLSVVRNLHFAQYGGYFIKGIYFLLAMITCFVIISGVMIWLAAREKKMYEHRKKFNTYVGAIYLGLCLGLYLAIAFFFCLTKILPAEMANRFDIMTAMFYSFWFGYTVYAYFSKNYFRITKNALIAAGILGIIIPVLNGIHSGLWFWKSLPLGYMDSFFIDVSWLVMGVITLIAAYKSKPTHKKEKPVGKEHSVERGQKSKIPVMSKERVKEPILVARSSQGI
ncbi:MAG: PepSY-associated TM helix domain-containing protein [Bacteroidota bacterium]